MRTDGTPRHSARWRRGALLALAVGGALVAVRVGTAPAQPAAAALPSDRAPEATGVTFRHVGVEQGLSNASVLAVAQDALGFLWIGTADGLDRYDGVEIRSFRHVPDSVGLASNVVQALAPGRSGAVWVGTAAGLDRYDPATEQLTPVPGLPADDVVRLLADTTGGVWVGTTGGVARVSPEGEVTQAVDIEGVGALAIHEGTLWVGTGEGLVRVDLASGDTERVASEAPFAVSSVVPSQSGGLLVGTFGEGLFRYDEGAGLTSIPLGGDVLGRVVSSVLEDDAGAIWVGTIGGGLRRVSPGAETAQVFTHRPDDASSLADDQVSALLQDRQGILWVATYGGLSRTDRARGAITRLRHDPQDAATLASNDVRALLVTRDGVLYAGTDQSLDRRTSPGRFVHQRIRSGPQTATLQAVEVLHQDAEGTIWVGTDGYGLLRQTASGDLAKVDAVQGDPGREASITSIWDDGEHLWVGTVSRGLYRYDPGRDEAERFTQGDGLSSDHVESLAVDASGDLWVGTSDGLCRLDPPDAFTCYAPGSGASDLREGYVQALLARPDGALWIGTRGGLHRLDTESPDEGFVLIESDALPGVSVYGLLEDADGDLWVSTNGGLAQVEPVTGTVTRTLDLGVGGRTLGGAMARGADGRVYVGGTQGVVVFSPERLDALNANPPQVRLVSIDVDGQAVRPGPDAPLEQAAPVADRLRLSHDQDVVTFRYAGLHFGDPARIRYRYRLDGFDGDWREAGDGGSRREVTYTNLDPGSYTFQVEATTADGIASETPAEIEVVVRPPWWRTIWATLAFAALALAALVRADRWQRRRLLQQERERAERRETELRAATAEAERRKAEAEADTLKAEAERQAAELERAREVSEANSKLAAANERLETSLADLQATQDQLVQAEKLASLGQLTAGIAHEIKNPLNFVNNFADLSVELADELADELHSHADAPVADLLENLDPLLADLKDNARRIHEHGQRADRIVRAMLLHSRGGSDEMARVIVNTFVEEYANLAYHGAKANDAEFQVVLERDFDAAAVEADVVPQELGRVLINLLSNAFYAVQKRVGEAGYQPTVTVRTRHDAATVSIEIEDNGVGIPAEAQARIFEPFFTTKPTGEGTGLGLSLAHDIVTGVHSGELDVESTPGEGTTFRITIPAAGGAPASEPPATGP